MQKILLSTTIALGVFALFAVSAKPVKALPVEVIKKQGSSISASVGGSISPVLQGYNDEPKISIDLPALRNYINFKVDGTTPTLNLTYGGYFSYRPADGAAGTDKAYIYIGHKLVGKFIFGKNNTVISKNSIDGSTIVPGFFQNFQGVSFLYNADTVDITNGTTPFGITYQTPSIYGVTLGYTYSNASQITEETVYLVTGSESAVGNIYATHDINARYDGVFGPVNVGLNAGARFSSVEGGAARKDIFAYTVGGQVVYSDGKNIGVQVAGGYHNQKNSATQDKVASWGIGLALNTPRVAGLTIGVLVGQSEKIAGSKTSYVGNQLSGAPSAMNYHVGIGIGYAWSDNFTQTLSYDKAFGGNAGALTSGYVWALASQLTF